VIDFLLRRSALRLAGIFREGIDRLDDAFDGGVAGLQRLDHVLLAYFLCTRLHHDEPFLAPGDHQVQAALPALLVRGVDDELSIHLSTRTPAIVF